MSLIVQKFGGSSVRDTERLLRMAHIAKERRDEGCDVVVVLSAQGDTTDTLLEKAHELTHSPDKRELDALLASGEQVSAALGALALKKLEADAISLSAWQVPVRTDGVHGDAQIETVGTERIRRELKKGRIVVVTGFQGLDEKDDITTLGRGGSDTSAVALAAALHADELIIYTDVDGIYSADPRLCPDALRRERISYDDMLLLAQKGAQVLHERSVALAQQYAVPIAVRSCGEKSAGSLVCEAGEESPVTGVTQQKIGKNPLASISAVGRALPDSAYKKKVVSALEGGGVRVCAVVTGERLMSVFVPREDAERALRLAHSALIEGKKT